MGLTHGTLKDRNVFILLLIFGNHCLVQPKVTSSLRSQEITLNFWPFCLCLWSVSIINKYWKPCKGCVLLGLKPRPSWVLGKQSANWGYTPTPNPTFLNLYVEGEKKVVVTLYKGVFWELTTWIAKYYELKFMPTSSVQGFQCMSALSVSQCQ